MRGHPTIQTTFSLKPIPSYFHVNEPLIKDQPSFKITTAGLKWEGRRGTTELLRVPQSIRQFNCEHSQVTHLTDSNNNNKIITIIVCYQQIHC